MAKKKPKKRRRHTITLSKVVTDSEFAAFIRAIPTGPGVRAMRERMVLWMLINTGIRASELCGLRVRDMPRYLGADFIEVCHGKGDKDRNVPVSGSFEQEIAWYMDNIRPKTVPQRYRQRSDQGWLFFTDRKRRLDRRYVYDLVSRTARRAGIEKHISPHKFRHRFCCWALNADGSNIYKVMGWMGHSSISTTQIYLKIAGMFQKGMGAALDQMPQGFRLKNLKIPSE